MLSLMKVLRLLLRDDKLQSAFVELGGLVPMVTCFSTLSESHLNGLDSTCSVEVLREQSSE